MEQLRNDTDPSNECAAPSENPAHTASGVSSDQLRANRANAERSTGPTSAEGKRRSSRNAIRHGAYASEVYAIEKGFLEEDFFALEEFVEGIVESLDPRTAAEHALAKRVAIGFVRLDRVDRAEHALLERAAAPTEEQWKGLNGVGDAQLAVESLIDPSGASPKQRGPVWTGSLERR